MAVRQEVQQKFNIFGAKEADKEGVKNINVVSLFSNPDTGRDFLVRSTTETPVDLDTLFGKYLVIWCVSLPLTTSKLTECQAIMFELYHRLVARAGGDLEVVIVANTEDPAVFNDFFTGFPGLTVPFSDSQSRASICECLGLTQPQTSPIVGVILDSEHMVVQENYCGPCFTHFGPSFFPFTFSQVKALDEIRGAVQRKLNLMCLYPNDTVLPPVSLADLLLCEPNVSLKRCRGHDHYEEKISVGQLSKKKCLGVYVCIDGSFLSQLASIYHECQEQGLEFEIIMVCDHWSKGRFEDFKRWCSQFGDTSSFWLFPYVYESIVHVKGLCKYDFQDSVLIVRPDDKSWERCGRGIMYGGGISLYPFTRESIKERITSFTLLPGDDYELPADKNLLVYVYKPEHFDSLTFSLLLKVLKAVPDLQIFFAPTRVSNLRGYDGKWPVLSPCVANRASLHLFTPLERARNPLASVVAFGKDGCMLSRRAEIYLKEPHKMRELFAGKLQQEEDAYLDRVVDEYMSEADYTFELA